MIKANNVRLLYAAALFTPQRGPNGEGEPKFSATIAFPKDHPVVAQILAGFKAVAQEKWKETAGDVYLELKAGGKLCLHDGDAKASKEGYKGNLYLSASNKLRPLIIDGLKQPLTAESGKPYSGCFVNATFELWAQENKWGRRINASLMGIQFLRDGPRLAGGSVSSVDDYEAVPEAVEQAAGGANANGPAMGAGPTVGKGPGNAEDIWK
jgi:hypothetical protein